MKKMLMLASVASMIDQFNMPNIEILKEMGYEVHVACNFKLGNTSSSERVEEFKKELKKLNIKYFQIDFSRSIRDVKMYIHTYKQVKRVLKNERYEFIHCHSPIGGVIGRIAAHRAGIKVIYTAHGFHFFRGAPIKNWLLYYPVERWLARYTDVLITINREDYEIAKKKFKANGVELVNGVGVDLKRFIRQTEELKESTRKDYGYNLSDYIMIAVGELNHNKNQGLLIDIVANLKDKLPNVKLLLVGTGLMKEQYEKKIKSLNLEDNVKLLGFRTDVNNLMLLSDVVVSASRREGLPVNILEGMAVGLPLVVTDCRGNRDLVVDGKNGFVVKIDKADEFSRRIEILYYNLDVKNFMRENNRLYIKKYKIVRIKKSMSGMYKKLETN